MIKTQVDDELVLMNTMNLSIVEIGKREYEKINSFVEDGYGGGKEVSDGKIMEYIETMSEEEFLIYERFFVEGILY